MRLFLLLFLSLLIESLNLQAQLQKMNFKHISKNEGLPSNNVLCILQDSDGFLWFGTNDGLAKYDGYSLQYLINTNNNQNFSDNKVNCLVQDRKGHLWIGTQKGLNCLNLNTLKLENDWKTNNSILASAAIYSMLFDSSQKLWIGTNSGLFVQSNNNLLFTQKDSLLSSNYILSICEDKSGQIWIGTQKGLNALNLKTGKCYQYFNNSYIKTILCDSKGAIWVATITEKCLWYSASATNIHFTAEGFSLNENSFISQIHEDKDGNYWLAIINSGIYFKQNGTNTWVNLRYNKYNPNGINSNVPQTVYSDRHGNVWIGFYDMGIDLVDKHRKAFTRISDNFSTTGLLNNKVRAIYQDSEGDIWIGTKIDGMLSKFNPVDFSFAHYKHNPANPSTISDDYIFCITEDRPGSLWVGTFDGGLNLFNKRTGKAIVFKNNPADKNSLASNSIYSLLKDNDGKL